MSFRWRKGRLSTSLSRRGPRIGYRLGCAIPIVIVILLAVALTACSPDSSASAWRGQTDCRLPWTEMIQVFDCGSPDYQVARTEGTQTVHIVVASKDPQAIAAAMAHAWNVHVPADVEAVVWVYSDAMQIGMGYDRGVLSAQGILGQQLVFEICTAWTEDDLVDSINGELCADTMKFTIEQ
jgi:hypothetical protein